MPGKHRIWAALVVTAALHAQAPETPKALSTDLSFGVYTTDKPTVMYRKFMPVVERLQEQMESVLEQEVAIELRIFKTYESAREALVEGRIDFARFGPASYVLAKTANPEIELLAMETKKGKRTFTGYIVVPATSPVRRLEDLRGRRFAFGDENSTIGRYLAQQELLAAGLRAKDLSAHAYLGRHDRVFRAVELGDYDAGALKSSTFKKLNKEQKLRILATFDNVTKPWVARAGLVPRVRHALGDALIGLRDTEALAALKVDGLVAAKDQAYDGIRNSMAASRGFLLQRASPAPGRDKD